MFALPTHPLRIVLEIANVRAISSMMQDDNDTDRGISENEREDPGADTLSSNIEKDDLETSKKSNINTRHIVIKQYKLQGFHRQSNGAVRILSLHALHFQICDIRLQPLHHHCSSTKSQPSIYYVGLMMYPPWPSHF
jgi:hypothetical protein